MLKNQYDQGRRDALAKFKLANLQQGAQGYNPTLNGQTGSANPASLSTPPTSPATPMAADVAKSKVLG
jgi:hypothetical protein